MIRKIIKTGHSLAATLPRSMLEEMGLKLGDAVKVELDKAGGQIVIRHGKKENQLPLGLKLRPQLKRK